MKRKILITLLVIGLILGLSACAPGGQSNPNSVIPQLSATGTGKVYVTPDVAYIYIGVHSESKNVNEAMSKNNTQARAVAASLTKQGVDPKDIQTTAFNVVPQQEFNQDGSPAGNKYMVDNTVFVTVRNLSNMGLLLDAVVSEGANSINGIQFDVQEKEQAQSQARKLAVQSAIAQAQELADAGGVKLGRLVSLNAYSATPPMPFYEGKGGAMKTDITSSAPTAAGQMVISVEASLAYEIQQ